MPCPLAPRARDSQDAREAFHRGRPSVLSKLSSTSQGELTMFRFVLSAGAIAGILLAQPAFAEPSAAMTPAHTQSATAERGKAIAYNYGEDDEVYRYRPGNNG
jgi:hypothetical protein